MDFVLIDLERSLKSGHITYWKDGEMGYTTDIKYAGLYTSSETVKIITADLDTLTVSISSANVDKVLGDWA